MRTANIKYAREHLRELIDSVAAGGEVMLLRRGQPVAKLVSVGGEPPRLPALASFRSSIEVKGRPISAEVIAAREDERY